MVVAAEDEFLLSNLRYFLRHGCTAPSAVGGGAAADVTYRVTFNGENPHAAALVDVHNARASHDDRLRPVRSLRRANVGFDFGGHLSALAEEAACCDAATGLCAALDGDIGANRSTASCGGVSRPLNFHRLAYDVFVALNVGVRGPFFPSYMPPGWHWTSAFADKLEWAGELGDVKKTAGSVNSSVALVGTSLACSHILPPKGSGRGPRVEGFAFAIARPALLHLLATHQAFAYHRTKKAAVIDGEYALSIGTLDAGWNIGSLLVEHDGVDFRDQATWDCNSANFPSRDHSYHGVSLHPLEDLFHKAKWHTIHNEVNYREMEVLTWARSRNPPGGGVPQERPVVLDLWGALNMPTLAPTPCAAVAENKAAHIGCPAGSTIASVDFASFGTPQGGCATGFTVDAACNSKHSMAVVTAACVGKQTCQVDASCKTFDERCTKGKGSFCFDVKKELAAKVTCSKRK